MDETKNSNKTEKKQYTKVESLKIVVGLLLLLGSLYIALAIISYFFTGGADQSLLEHLDLTTTDEIRVEVKNWMGYRGASLAEFLVAKTFGIACLLIDYFIFRWSVKLIGFGNVKVFRLFCNCLYFTVWLSFVFSFVGAENSFFNFGGQIGKSEVNWVESQIGAPGAVLLIVLTLILYLLFVQGMSLVQIKDKFIYYFGFKFIKKLRAKDNNDKEEKCIDKNDNEQHQPQATNGSEKSTDMDATNQEKTEIVDTPAANAGNGQEGGVFATGAEEKGENLNEIVSKEDATKSVSATCPVGDENVEQESLVTETTEVPTKDVSFILNKNTGDDTNAVVPDDTFDEEAAGADADDKEEKINKILEELGPYDPTEELHDYEMPSVNLLVDYPSNDFTDADEQLNNKNRITTVLANFGIEITSVEATVGPTITLYEIVPAPGVRISKIQGLERDIALSLAARGIRIIAPIPGKGTIGIEVPNKNPQIVSMRSLIASQAFQETKMELPIAFGRTITNEVFMVDLAKTPHLLVAGATGTGKSVGLNVLLTSLLYKKHPATLKLVIVDPKKVEFSIYEKIEKHYLAKLPGEADAIITDTTKVVQTLTSLTTEMENRYTLLADVHLRNIKEYNAKFISRRINPAKELPNGLMHHYLPYIVVIIDEYGDLLMTAGKDVELPIARIAQKARAVGIHMVIATQRPSVKIVTGIIKANFPARLAFRVASSTDSRTILDSTGAQELIGRGDMLYSTGGVENTRVQCALVDTPEVESVNEFIANQHGYPEAYRLPEFVDENGDVVGAVEIDTKSLDPRLREAAELVVNAQNGSTSNIQRTLEVGFNRAGRIMDQLEAIGVVGPVCGSKPRAVLVQFLEDLDIIFANLK